MARWGVVFDGEIKEVWRPCQYLFPHLMALVDPYHMTTGLIPVLQSKIILLHYPKDSTYLHRKEKDSEKTLRIKDNLYTSSYIVNLKMMCPLFGGTGSTVIV